MRVTGGLLLAMLCFALTFATVLSTVGCATTAAAKASEAAEAKVIIGDIERAGAAFAVCAWPDASATLTAIENGDWTALFKLAACIPTAIQAYKNTPSVLLPPVANLYRAQTVLALHIKAQTLIDK